ncbi:MAG: amino acid ABC transporter permease [Proteobacteria bacterium]|nr:amino acid ABC transporter permease [Pseudomonadota bacterium]
MKYNWNWGVLVEDPYLFWLLSGLEYTLLLSLSAWVIAFSLGSAIGVSRTLPLAWPRKLATAYVELFRNVPLLVQMFLWFFVVPELLPADLGRWVKRDMPFPEFWTAVVCLGFYTASRVGEQVRAGIQSIPRGQYIAALATGLGWMQAYRLVLLPLAFRLIVPPMTSEFLNIFKNSSLALTIGVLELTAQSRQIENYTFQGFEAFTAATVLYLVITMIVMLSMRWMESRTRVVGMIGTRR